MHARKGQIQEREIGNIMENLNLGIFIYLKT